MQIRGTGGRSQSLWQSVVRIVGVAMSLALACFCAGGALAQNGRPPDGVQVFNQNGCFACHGQMGNGGAGPRFRQDPFLGFTDYVIGQILLGRNIMPSFAGRLSDEQIAAVATYVRNSWGNHFGEVKPEQVAQVRKKLEAEQDQTASSK